MIEFQALESSNCRVNWGNPGVNLCIAPHQCQCSTDERHAGGYYEHVSSGEGARLIGPYTIYVCQLSSA